MFVFDCCIYEDYAFLGLQGGIYVVDAHYFADIPKCACAIVHNSTVGEIELVKLTARNFVVLRSLLIVCVEMVWELVKYSCCVIIGYAKCNKLLLFAIKANRFAEKFG